jgi:hypothetical protein
VGLETTTYRLLKELDTDGKTCLCLGYPDLLVLPEEISGTYDELADAERIRQWHRWPHPVYDTSEVLTKELGFKEIDYADIVQTRGPERIVDLNYPTDWGKEYDIIIDGGTAEHCFNIGQVFSNIVAAVRPNGGIVIHINPLNMLNHGFWNINPTAYHDFYKDNGFEMISASGVGGPLDDRTVVSYNDAHLRRRFDFEQTVEITNIIALRCTGKKNSRIIWPMQSKYR